MIDPAAGVLLIADPFLKDPNFLRTVVLLCEHKEAGSFGFVLNKQIEQTLDELISDLEGHRLPVYYGGPVQMDTIHFLHQYPDLIPESVKVSDGIFWGGNFETVRSWLTVKANQGLVFNTGFDEIWKNSLKTLGGEYERMINYPIDPQLN